MRPVPAAALINHGLIMGQGDIICGGVTRPQNIPAPRTADIQNLPGAAPDLRLGSGSHQMHIHPPNQGQAAAISPIDILNRPDLILKAVLGVNPSGGLHKI